MNMDGLCAIPLEGEIMDLYTWTEMSLRSMGVSL